MSLSYPSVVRGVEYAVIWYVEKLIFMSAFILALFLL